MVVGQTEIVNRVGRDDNLFQKVTKILKAAVLRYVKERLFHITHVLNKK